MGSAGETAGESSECEGEDEQDAAERACAAASRGAPSDAHHAAALGGGAKRGALHLPEGGRGADALQPAGGGDAAVAFGRGRRATGRQHANGGGVAAVAAAAGAAAAPEGGAWGSGVLHPAEGARQQTGGVGVLGALPPARAGAVGALRPPARGGDVGALPPFARGGAVRGAVGAQPQPAKGAAVGALPPPAGRGAPGALLPPVMGEGVGALPPPRGEGAGAPPSRRGGAAGVQLQPGRARAADALQAPRVGGAAGKKRERGGQAAGAAGTGAKRGKGRLLVNVDPAAEAALAHEAAGTLTALLKATPNTTPHAIITHPTHPLPLPPPHSTTITASNTPDNFFPHVPPVQRSSLGSSLQQRHNTAAPWQPHLHYMQSSASWPSTGLSISSLPPFVQPHDMREATATRNMPHTTFPPVSGFSLSLPPAMYPADPNPAYSATFHPQGAHWHPQHLPAAAYRPEGFVTDAYAQQLATAAPLATAPPSSQIAAPLRPMHGDADADIGNTPL